MPNIFKLGEPQFADMERRALASVVLSGLSSECVALDVVLGPVLFFILQQGKCNCSVWVIIRTTVKQYALLLLCTTLQKLWWAPVSTGRKSQKSLDC